MTQHVRFVGFRVFWFTVISFCLFAACNKPKVDDTYSKTDGQKLEADVARLKKDVNEVKTTLYGSPSKGSAEQPKKSNN